MTPKKKVLVVVGPQMFREFLCSMLEAGKDLEVVDQIFDGFEAVEAVKQHIPDFLLLDLCLPRYSGVSVLHSVRGAYPDMKIMVLTDYKSDQLVLEAFEAGANGYCIKDSSYDELLVAVRSIISGRTYICPGIAGEVMEGYLRGRRNKRQGSDWEILTQREKEVLKLLAEGFRNREIGNILHISSKTVEKHRSNIMKKLGLHNVAALTAFAIEHGLVTGAYNSFLIPEISSSGHRGKSEDIGSMTSVN